MFLLNVLFIGVMKNLSWLKEKKTKFLNRKINLKFEVLSWKKVQYKFNINFSIRYLIFFYSIKIFSLISRSVEYFENKKMKKLCFFDFIQPKIGDSIIYERTIFITWSKIQFLIVLPVLWWNFLITCKLFSGKGSKCFVKMFL